MMMLPSGRFSLGLEAPVHETFWHPRSLNSFAFVAGGTGAAGGCVTRAARAVAAAATRQRERRAAAAAARAGGYGCTAAAAAGAQPSPGVRTIAWCFAAYISTWRQPRARFQSCGLAIWDVGFVAAPLPKGGCYRYLHEIRHLSSRCIQGYMSLPFLPQGMVSPAARSSVELTPAERHALQQRHAQQQASFQVRTFLKNTGCEARGALSCQRRVAGISPSIAAKHVSAFKYLAACRLAGAIHQCDV